MTALHWTNWTTGGVHWTAETPEFPYFLNPGPVGPIGPMGISARKFCLSESEAGDGWGQWRIKRYRGFRTLTNRTNWTILVFQWLMAVLHWTARRDHLDRPSESAGPSRRAAVGGTLSRFVSIRTVK